MISIIWLHLQCPYMHCHTGITALQEKKTEMCILHHRRCTSAAPALCHNASTTLVTTPVKTTYNTTCNADISLQALHLYLTSVGPALQQRGNQRCMCNGTHNASMRACRRACHAESCQTYPPLKTSQVHHCNN